MQKHFLNSMKNIVCWFPNLLRSVKSYLWNARNLNELPKKNSNVSESLKMPPKSDPRVPKRIQKTPKGVGVSLARQQRSEPRVRGRVENG